MRGEEYDEFVEEFVTAVTERWPHVLLQWEDFAKANATRLLERYRDRLCTFNDDIQGTAAVATGTLLSAIDVTGVPLTEQRIAIFGAGSAGCGIASLLMAAMVEAGVDAKDGGAALLHGRSGRPAARGHELDHGVPAAVRAAARRGRESWPIENPARVTLLDVVRNAKPTTLIGVSGQPGAFSEPIVRAMAENNRRPVIFPLSNPTSRAEATPADIERWSDGRAVIGTGSPFPPLMRDGREFKVDQTNNSYIFPGVGLGVIAVQARRLTDTMFMAAAKALAAMSPAKNDSERESAAAGDGAARRSSSRWRSRRRLQARKEGLTDVAEDEIEAAIHAKMWSPKYLPYRRATSERSQR